ncbi:MAG: hypothetical protein ABW061_29640 [Polyangiaceae bacterium]
MPIDATLGELLAAVPGGGFSLERIERSDFNDELLRPLHAFAALLMAEPYEHFVTHANTNDELHVFRRIETGAVEGFQFWRCLPGATERARLVLGGKLRVRPSARHFGLHLCSGLAVLLDEQRRFPTARITRLGIASLFGFVSVVRRLARYEFVDVSSRADLIPFVDAVTRVSRYEFDPATGQVEVGIFMTAEQLEAYPASYFESAPARAYSERNRDFRWNGRYLAFAFDVDRGNVDALAQGAAESALGAGAEAKAFGKKLSDAWLKP